MDWVLVVSIGVAGLVGWLTGRGTGSAPRRGWSAAGPRDPVATDPPELAWVVRANGAQAGWLRRGRSGAVSAITLDRRMSEAVHQMALARLAGVEHAESRVDVERLDEGVLVYLIAEDIQIAVLLPTERGVEQCREDLELLAGVLRGQEALGEAVASPATPEQSVRGVATHLAFELERVVEAAVAVAVRRPRGPQVVATSASADPHLLRRYAVPGSAVDLVIQDRVNGTAAAYDPIGNMPADRRQRSGRGWVYPVTDAGQAVVGAVVLWTRDGSEPAGAGRARLEALLAAAGPRLQDALERDDLRDRAVRDPLTGLLNRQGLADRMALVSHDRGAVLMCDLDNFKRLNDTLGHPAGDAALVRVASVMEDVVRSQDAVARLGGEEFAIWLPGAGLDEARVVAERLRSRIADMWWSWKGRAWLLSVSVGVAVWPDTTRSRDNLLAQADAALYRAKERGRNRVEAAVG
jgi:diguanylate cyclase (GGDEF)-like protein